MIRRSLRQRCRRGGGGQRPDRRRPRATGEEAGMGQPALADIERSAHDTRVNSSIAS